MSCQPTWAETTELVTSPAPTRLVSWPPAVWARFAANRSGMAAGMDSTTRAEPTRIPANVRPAYSAAPTGPTVWNTAVGETPR